MTTPVEYDNIREYIKSKTVIKEKIAALEAVKLALMDSMYEGALKADIEEYQINDGQTIIKEIFRNPDQIIKAIKGINFLINEYINDGIGRTFKLRDQDSFYVNKR